MASGECWQPNYRKRKMERNIKGTRNKCTRAIEHNITWEELEDEASEYDVKADNLEYRKRKNKFFDTECKESKPKRRKKRPQVIEAESEDEVESGSGIVELIEIEE